MMKFYKTLFTILIISFLSVSASAQEGYWTARADNSGFNKYKAVERVTFPKELKLFNLDITPLVFRTEKENEFIEPYSADAGIYAVFKSRREKGKLPWFCSNQDKLIEEGLRSQLGNVHRTESKSGEFKTIRLAQSCNGEYANWFGASAAGTAADQAIVLAAFNATLTRCNGCYCRFQVIPIIGFQQSGLAQQIPGPDFFYSQAALRRQNYIIVFCNRPDHFCFTEATIKDNFMIGVEQALLWNWSGHFHEPDLPL